MWKNVAPYGLMLTGNIFWKIHFFPSNHCLITNTENYTANYCRSSDFTPASQWAAVTYDGLRSSDSSIFDLTTGSFIVPMDGNYEFIFQAASDSVSQ